jgi:hypothetical protein
VPARLDSPLVIAFAHPDSGIVADAVMMSEYEVRPLFGFSFLFSRGRGCGPAIST